MHEKVKFLCGVYVKEVLRQLGRKRRDSLRDSADECTESEPADNRMLKADCHHRFDTFDTGLNPSPPVLLVTENFQVVTGRSDLARALRFRR